MRVSVDVECHKELDLEFMKNRGEVVDELIRRHMSPWAPHLIYCESEVSAEGACSIFSNRSNEKSIATAFMGESQIPMIISAMAERSLFDGVSLTSHGHGLIKTPAKRI